MKTGFVKKNVTYKSKSATTTKQKQLQKFKKQYKLYFGTLVLDRIIIVEITHEIR